MRDVQAESDRLFQLASEAFRNSTLPPEPNYQAAETLVMRILEDVLWANRI